MRTVVALLMSVLLLCGCASGPNVRTGVEVDGSSAESFRFSWEQLNSQLTAGERHELMLATLRIVFAPYGSADEVPEDVLVRPLRPELIREKVDGMTYAEIMALADESSVELEVLPAR